MTRDLAPARRTPETSVVAAAEARWLLLNADGHTIAVAADVAAAVLPTPAVIRVPGADAQVCGVISVHGALVPLIDTALLDGATTVARTRRWSVVLQIGNRRAALTVDALPVLRIAAAARRPATAASTFGLDQQISLDGATVPLLDANRLMDGVFIS
jgi:chemotaxis signal transduction protein